MADISALMLKVDSSGVQKATADLKNFSKSASDASSSSGQINEALSGLNMNSLAAAAGVGATVAALYKLTSALTGAAKASLQMYSHFEQMENGLATVFQSAEKGKAVFEDLRKFSFDTTFGVDELADAATQLYNVGMAEDEVKNKLKMLGDLAGGQKQKFAELVSVYGKIVSTGRAGAMQMQQLALRGIPIRQELEKIGVTGTATAEQITKAFENMTGEGGRFHNAMENIIGTIEGKEGFITDTMKEISVNFAEASGLADFYKDSLDGVYKVVEWINDKLMEVNDNPTMKMILQGVLLAAIGALVAIIGTALVPVLTVAAGLIGSLLAAAGPLIAVGAGLAVVAGAAYGTIKEVNAEAAQISDAYGKVAEKQAYLTQLEVQGTTEINKKIEAQRKLVAIAKEQLAMAEKYERYGGGSANEARANLSQQQTALNILESEKRYREEIRAEIQKTTDEYTHNAEITKQLTKEAEKLQKKEQENLLTFEEQYRLQQLKVELARRAVVDAGERYITGGDIMEQIKESELDPASEAYRMELEKLKVMEEERVLLEKYANAYKYIKSEAEQINKIVDQKAKGYNEIAAAVEKIYKNTKEGKREELLGEIAAAQAVIDKGQLKKTGRKFGGFEEIVRVELDPDVKKKYEDAIKKWQAELDKLNLSEFDKAVIKARQNLNQIANQTKVGFSTELQKMEAELAVKAAEIQRDLNNGTRVEKVKEEVEAYKRLNAEIEHVKSTQSAWADYQKTAIMQTLGGASIGDSKLSYQKAIESEIAAKLTELQGMDSTNPANMDRVSSLKEEIALLVEKRSELEKERDIYGAIKDNLTAIFQEFGATQQVSDLFADTLTNIISTQIPNTLVSGFQAIGKALGEGADAGDEMGEVFRNLLTQLMGSLAATCLQAGMMFIAQSGWAGLGPAIACWAIGGLAGIGAGLLGSLSDTKNDAQSQQKEQLELLKAINEQYKKLYDALQEEEAYYLEKKRQINSSGVNAAAGLTSVNDMVITPYGNFSTSPKDYLFAMEHPESLMSGQMNMSVTINNTMGDSANVTAQRSVGPDGQQQLVVMISKKIAQDYATGMNGWDTAIDRNNIRRQGRSLA